MRTGLIGFVALIICAMLLLAGGSQTAHAATPTPTPIPSDTPVFTYGGPIVLPTSIFGIVPTLIPLGTRRALGLDFGQPMQIAYEAENMRYALFEVMGLPGQILNLALFISMGISTLILMRAIIVRGQRIQMALSGTDIDYDKLDTDNRELVAATQRARRDIVARNIRKNVDLLSHKAGQDLISRGNRTLDVLGHSRKRRK